MYKNILIPVDLSNDEVQQKALQAGVNIAKNNHSKVHLITVVPDFGMSIVNTYFPEGHAKTMMADAEKKLNQIIDESLDEELKRQAVVAYGTIYSEIINYANSNGIDLIVMASHRPELKDYLLGPNAARVTRHASCSTMVVRV